MIDQEVLKEIQDGMRAEGHGKEGWFDEVKRRYVDRLWDVPAWTLFFRQLHDAYPDGFDPTDVIRDEGKFTFPAGVGEEKPGAPRWMWLNCEFKNRIGQISGGLKLTHERRNGVEIEGVVCNTLFWWRVVEEVSGE